MIYDTQGNVCYTIIIQLKTLSFSRTDTLCAQVIFFTLTHSRFGVGNSDGKSYGTTGIVHKAAKTISIPCPLSHSHSFFLSLPLYLSHSLYLSYFLSQSVSLFLTSFSICLLFTQTSVSFYLTGIFMSQPPPFPNCTITPHRHRPTQSARNKLRHEKRRRETDRIRLAATGIEMHREEGKTLKCEKFPDKTREQEKKNVSIRVYWKTGNENAKYGLSYDLI